MNDPLIIPDMSKGTITVSHSAIKAYVDDVNASHEFFITTDGTAPGPDEEGYCRYWTYQDGEVVFDCDEEHDGFSIEYDTTYTIYVRAAERNNYKASNWVKLGTIHTPSEGTGE